MAVKLNVVIPEHMPGVRTPSRQNVGMQVNPEMPVFVHDSPDASASVQSPGPPAFGSRFEASQLAKFGSRRPNGVVMRVWPLGHAFKVTMLRETVIFLIGGV